jgi:hypothetical protein
MNGKYSRAMVPVSASYQIIGANYHIIGRIRSINKHTS